MPLVSDASVNLLGEFVVRQGTEDLPGEFVVNQWQEDLPGEFFVNAGFEDLPAEFVSRNATTVGATAAAGHDPILNPYQKSPFYAARRRWVFYSNGVNLAFRSSVDGVAWSAETMVRPCTSGEQFSIHFDGTYVHYAYASGLPGVPHHLFYCRGAPQTNGTITWSQVEQEALGIGEPLHAYQVPSVSVDKDGYPWIAYRYLYDDGGDPNYLVYAVKAHDADGTFDPWTPDWIDSALAATVRPLLLALKEGMYIFWDKDDDILGRINEDSAAQGNWTAEEDTGADIAAPGLYDAISFLDHVHLAWTEKTTLKLQHRQRVYGTGWSASHEIYDAVLADMGPSISRGSQGKDPKLYVFWAPDEANPTADHVFHSLSTDDGVTWGAQVDWIDESADGFPLPNQQSVFEVQGEFYIGCVWVRSSPDDIRYYELEDDANGFEDLAAEFEVGQGSEDLPGEFIVKQWAEDLKASFEGQTSVDLPAEFIVGQWQEDLPGEFVVRHVGTPVNLPGEFIVRQERSVNLAAEFVVRHVGIPRNLPGEFIIQHETSVNLLAEFVVRHVGIPRNLLAEFVVRHIGIPRNLLGEFAVRQERSVDLLGEFIVRQERSVNLAAEFVVRHVGIPRNLPAELIIRHRALGGLFGKFIVRHSATLNLPGEFIIRHASPVTLGNLFAIFAVRSVYPYWTDRRYVNGVIDAAEALIGDAKLEFIIEGVMDDIKVWADANTVIYSSWTNINVTPTAIKRATTYGVVAALYARHTKTFQGQVIPTLAPVTVTVTGDQEKAMEHWEGKRKEMLELYLSAQGFERIWISTADEEPVFTMEDIPTDITGETSWLEFLRLREA